MWFQPGGGLGNVAVPCVRRVCCFPRLLGGRAAPRAAGRIPESWTPCGKDMAITASAPIPPVLEQATSVWGRGSLFTLLAGGA